jgi:inosine-uridine nucleoside N-ribohydrolase
MRRRIPKIAPWVTAVVLLPSLVAVLSFTISIPGWPAGERKVAPLALVRGGPPVAMPRRVWIDTDAACGHASHADADDCFALLILLRAPGIEVVAIATVHGNAPVEVADGIVHQLVALAGRERAPPIHRGSAAASQDAAAPAHAALREALAAGPLTIVALGPLTNIAAALRGRPDLGQNVGRLVAVMGRRPGHLFHPAEGRGNGILFGHGPVFRDFNFEKDRAAAVEILSLELPVTLVPYEAARNVTLNADDLALLDAAGGLPAWVAGRARGWLDFWAAVVGRDGFYPFDALAAAYTLEPALFDCARTPAWVANDRKLGGRLLSPVALLVGTERERAEKPRASAEVVYCPRISPRMHAWLMARLAAVSLP